MIRERSSCSLLGLFGIGGLLVATSLIAGVSADATQSVENTLLGIGLVVGHLDHLDNGSSMGEGHDGSAGLVSSGGRLESLGGGVVHHSLLRLVLTAREEDHLRFVFLESVGVHVELLLGRAGATVVNADADGAGKISTETSDLKLGEGETTAKTDLTGVATSSRRDNGTEALNRAGEDTGSLVSASHGAGLFLSRLVKVSLDAVDPVFAQMDVRNIVVVLDHC
jgi:hypothetical protein